MDIKPDILRIASAMASHASARQSVVANNIANADTPGFKARDTQPFEKVYSVSDSSVALRATRPQHFQSEQTQQGSGTLNRHLVETSGASSPNGNSVSLEEEMSKAVELRHDYDLALTVYKKSMDILRTSLGR
jgi:flagellar basal-body rod protein FlgB